MYQGSIGKFENKVTGDSRWLWKVRAPGGAGRPAYLDMETGEWVDSTTITDTNTDGYMKDWVLTLELTTEEAIKCLQFSAPDDTVLHRKREVGDLLRQRADLKADIWHTDNKISSLMEEVGRLSDRRGKAKLRLWEIDQKLMQYPEEERCMWLVHASHKADDTVDYCWYADKALAETLSPGDVVVCETSRGEQRAIVRKVDKTFDWEPHKKVLRKCGGEF